MNLKISKGNMKVPYANISSTPVKDCINCSECKKDCYALKSYKQYPAVRNAWNNNSDILRNHLDIAERDLIAFLDKYKKSYFRFNVAGDIISQGQFNMYKHIARTYPDIQFLSFTKCYDFDFSAIPDNYSVVLSIWPEMTAPDTDLPKAYLFTDKRKNNTIHCSGSCRTCTKCWDLKNINKNIEFTLH